MPINDHDLYSYKILSLEEANKFLKDIPYYDNDSTGKSKKLDESINLFQNPNTNFL